MTHILKHALRRTAECPPFEALAEHLDLPDTDKRNQTARHHLRGCLHCSAEITLLRQFESCKPAPDELSAVEAIQGRLRPTKSPRRQSWWARFGEFAFAWKAAAACAMLLVGILISHPWRGDQRTHRASDFDGDVMRSRTIETQTANGDQTSIPQTLQWAAVPGAVRYSVELTEIDGTRVFYGNVTTPSLVLPAGAVTLLGGGRMVLWQVIAENGAGAEIARSGVQRVRVVTRPGVSH